jgi:hypothetical protein
MVLACSGLSAQLFSPFNVEIMGGGQAVPIPSFGYKPHLIVAWNPQFGEPVLGLHATGIPVKFVIRAAYIQHPSWWTGSWAGATNIPAIIEGSFFGASYLFPYQNGNPLFTGLNMLLQQPGEWTFNYGPTFGTTCCYGMPVVPDLVVLFMEVQM